MQFKIIHRMHYEYSRRVFLEPHQVRLHPANCGYQTLREFALDVQPKPAGMSCCLDPEGNTLASLWFEDEHDHLTITARSHVLTQRENAYDFLLRPQLNGLPLKYGQQTASLLSPALARGERVAPPDDVASFAAQLRQKSGGRLLDFLNILNETIYEQFECVRREQGHAWPPSQTLADRRGACRDFAVLFMDVCRCLGIAARFVSGYQEGDALQDQRDLHAWAEVYVPGGGWRGFDPTHGLAVADRHVRVAASADPARAAPIVGSLRGNGAVAGLQAQIRLDAMGPLAGVQQQSQQQQTVADVPRFPITNE